MLKPELQAKFLRHLSTRKNKSDEGFTLIELLVVVIIIGVLAAIALPSLLGQVNKAKQAEPKNYLGTVNRAQQAFFLEYQNFATSLDQLQVGIKTASDNFAYKVTGGTDITQFKGTATKKALKSYYGVVGTTASTSATSESLTLAIACESPAPTQTEAVASTNFSSCDNNWASLAR